MLGGLQGAGLGIARMSQTGLSWAAFIKALEGVTDSNTLARPSVTTLDNVEAIFKAGQETNNPQHDIHRLSQKEEKSLEL